jgi:hypothetical protein
VSDQLHRISLLGTDPSSLESVMAAFEKARERGFHAQIKTIESSGTLTELWIENASELELFEKELSTLVG